MKQTSNSGMTLVEILLVVALVALLAVFLIPVAQKAIESKENSLCASRLRTAVAAFEMYRSEMGSYPADKTPSVTPPEMTGYFADLHIDDWWGDVNELGGRWDWDNGYHYKYSVSVSAPTRSTDQLTDFDRLVDDGNLATGRFRKNGSQYHYILEE